MTADSTLTTALRQFEATEANLIKIEKLWDECKSIIPGDLCFGNDPTYDDLCRSINHILKYLPKIADFQLQLNLYDLNEIGQMRLDARELGEIEVFISVENAISSPDKEIAKYRFRFNNKRKQLIRAALTDLIEEVDSLIHSIDELTEQKKTETINDADWNKLQNYIAQIDTLLGSSIKRPTRWPDLQQRLQFALIINFKDVQKIDWPEVKQHLMKDIYDKYEPIPIEVADLSEITNSKPHGAIATKLRWETLDDDTFERLIFVIISGTTGYENPEWLMRTNAADKGRDLSVVNITNDPLLGVTRKRMIIQCKHWQSKSISIEEISRLKEQMKLWEPPRVDILVIATSGRFTVDAVSWIEKHNESNEAMKIHMWAESHLERLLASQPAIIAEFRLR